MVGMLRVFCRRRAVVVAALLMAPVGWGQVASTVGAQTVTDVLHQMSDQADVIFMGQVLAVRLPSAGGAASGIVEVEFRVDEAIRGCTAGEQYVLREWGGLWTGESQRYLVGQRLLMLLHGPSAGGMSSPVGGLDGAIPIRQSVMAASLEKSAQPSLPFVDLRQCGDGSAPWLYERCRRFDSFSASFGRRRSGVIDHVAEGTACHSLTPVCVNGSRLERRSSFQ